LGSQVKRPDESQKEKSKEKCGSGKGKKLQRYRYYVLARSGVAKKYDKPYRRHRKKRMSQDDNR
jgi:hypothetical protein